uniref:Protein RESISTANCE TO PHYTOPHTHORA 1, chloroplastic n=1 Tax=Chlamydomonas leiostraca TaxID=1034604 RepID=A0A7S0WWS8_9CHLO|mmetsp:Transcript_32961/g.83692  ORF Transcript_32961/g.83692 Transcript_32961/m.83692 type:complete len:228 (+) Transcript_32961:46-729(+)|eukprot:CAMPEP_0202867220 /NCGR_PEP_ID=MMETSP1391-20130828/8950_1 /ASSEMBLY_ACC=CAM_ASM_000867 /TAXON_ID=1034604 /ORGANISM="Chlamydomonas leiostraca, Strain SAG 11-49" /LENGTH=227 /DNA_ID=CAMNT_0049547237 /DNA_START=39 /DNA_END=722 /DNA_ORIENTATION=-
MLAQRATVGCTRTSFAFSTTRIARRVLRFSGNTDGATTTTTAAEDAASTSGSVDITKDLAKFTRQTAGTFAPRSSTASKNPAVKGSLLYNIFEVQAWVTLVVGGLLSFNIIWPTDEPSIARLMGMWAIWMFTIPSLRAKECTGREKEALNYMFVGMPLMNILLPFISKSFPFIYVMDVAMVVGLYYWKGVWQEVYGIPFAAPGALDQPAAFKDGSSSSSSSSEEQKQ